MLVTPCSTTIICSHDRHSALSNNQCGCAMMRCGAHDSSWRREENKWKTKNRKGKIKEKKEEKRRKRKKKRKKEKKRKMGDKQGKDKRRKDPVRSDPSHVIQPILRRRRPPFARSEDITFCWQQWHALPLPFSLFLLPSRSNLTVRPLACSLALCSSSFALRPLPFAFALRFFRSLLSTPLPLAPPLPVLSLPPSLPPSLVRPRSASLRPSISIPATRLLLATNCSCYLLLSLASTVSHPSRFLSSPRFPHRLIQPLIRTQAISIKQIGNQAGRSMTI